MPPTPLAVCLPVRRDGSAGHRTAHHCDECSCHDVATRPSADSAPSPSQMASAHRRCRCNPWRRRRRPPSPTAGTPEARHDGLPDYRPKWLGASAVAVAAAAIGAAGRHRGAMAATSAAVGGYLPAAAMPAEKSDPTGVCCYRYKFFIDTGVRQRWLHDPSAANGQGSDGKVNNFMCKYARGRTASRSTGHIRTTSSDGGSGGVPLTAAAAAAAAKAAKAARPRPSPPRRRSVDAAWALAAVAAAAAEGASCCRRYFNGTALSSTRGLGGCCEVCSRRRGAAVQLAARAAACSCVLFGERHGVPRGTALSSAGVVRVPLYPPESANMTPPSPPLVAAKSRRRQKSTKRRKKSRAASP